MLHGDRFDYFVIFALIVGVLSLAAEVGQFLWGAL
jgi:hypothetical protein